ncbi:hypothetical protein [Klebsiella pneumoniae]|uniref:hypothetical protein n=1 Tax=Klebsiella pneumoniae TaxID=573 RepID=UPI001D0D81D5|nr:hypothetical protein [Klebsiella pneumoniae]
MAAQPQNRTRLYQKSTQPIPDLIAKLQQRGLIINDMSAATTALTFIGYFRLRGYCLPYYQMTQKKKTKATRAKDFHSRDDIRGCNFTV